MRLRGSVATAFVGALALTSLAACQSNSSEPAPSASASPSATVPTPAPPAYIYQPAPGWKNKPEGTVLASAPIPPPPAGVSGSDVAPADATGKYIQFRTATATGRPAVSSGTAYFPAGDSANRPVVVWAHGTVGAGDDCAPSKNTGPIYGIWGLQQFLQAGWIVVAPDYAGLGTPGENEYLVPQAATNDLVNSVRAVSSMPGAKASKKTILIGISQGSYNVLATESGVAKKAPDLQIVAAVAESPAANIPAFVSQEWTSVSGWLVDT